MLPEISRLIEPWTSPDVCAHVAVRKAAPRQPVRASFQSATLCNLDLLRKRILPLWTATVTEVGSKPA